MKRRILTLASGAGLALAVATPALAAGAQGTAPPHLSLHPLFLAGYTKKEVPGGVATGRTGVFAHQVEVRAWAPVDSVTTGAVTVVLPGDQGARVSEAFVRRRLGEGLTLRAGRFYPALGLHNVLHPQEYPFLDPPLVLERFFGPDGLDEVGIGLEWSLPTPWPATGSLEIVNGDNRLWVNPTDEDLLYLARVRNAWQAGRRTRVQLGGSWAGGRNLKERLTYVAAADLLVTRKAGQRPAAPGLTWQSEYAYARENLKTAMPTRGGFYTFLEYRTTGPWLGRLRYDYYGLPEPAQGWEDRVSLLLGLERNPRFPLRFQYSRWRVDRDGRGYNQYHVQLNFSLQAG